MDETIPVVDTEAPGVPATVILTDGTHLHVRLQPGAWLNGGVFVAVKAVEKVHRGDREVSLPEALGLDERHLGPEHTVWIPGQRVQWVIVAGEGKRSRPIGFAT